MSTPKIIQAIWNNKTQSEWFESGVDRLYSKKRWIYPVGTIVVCINVDTYSIFGVAIIAGECELRDLLDMDSDLYLDAYTSEINYYEYKISNFRKFMTPIACDTVSTMCGVDVGVRSWWYHLDMRSPYLAGDKVDHMIKMRFISLVNTWI